MTTGGLIITPDAAAGSSWLDFKVEFAKKTEVKISTAAYMALRDVGEDIKKLTRASIRRAPGRFGQNWQNAMQVKLYPQSRPSIDAALFVYNKIPYADVFEQGSRISGNPYLWIPTKNAPVRIAGRHPTPKLFARNFGRLFSARNRKGKAPILLGRFGSDKHRRPMFVGIRTAQMPKAFQIRDAIERGANPARFDRYYNKYLAMGDQLARITNRDI